MPSESRTIEKILQDGIDAEIRVDFSDSTERMREAIDLFASEQGWNRDTLLELATRFIASKGLGDNFVRYMRFAQNEENADDNDLDLFRHAPEYIRAEIVGGE